MRLHRADAVPGAVAAGVAGAPSLAPRMQQISCNCHLRLQSFRNALCRHSNHPTKAVSFIGFSMKHRWDEVTCSLTRCIFFSSQCELAIDPGVCPCYHERMLAGQNDPQGTYLSPIVWQLSIAGAIACING